MAVVSLGLNLALAAVGLHLAWRPSPSPSAPPVVEVISKLAPAPVVSSAGDKTTAAFIYTTNSFRWAKLESENWTQLAGNLRAIGCPEKTVCDILFARAIRLRSEEDEDLRERLRPALGRAADFFGTDPEMFWLRGELDFDEQALGKFLLGPMADDIYQRLAVRMQRDRKLGRDLDAGFKDSIALVAKKKRELAAQLHRDVTALLTASQLEEMTARMEVDSHCDREWQIFFETIGLTGAEFRQLMVSCARLHDPLSESVQLIEKPDDLDEKIQAMVRASLGPQRYALYDRAQDSRFQEIYQVAKSEAWPPVTRDQVYEIQKFAEQESVALNDDASLTEEDRHQLRQQMQVEVRQSVSALLGEKAWGEYLKRNSAHWMTNLTNP